MKNRAGVIGFPYCRLYYKAIVIKTVWYWHKNRNIDQQIRIDSLPMSACTYDHLIYDKGAKNIKWEKKDSLFNKWCQENQTAPCKRKELGHSSTPYIKIKLKWIRDLSVR